MAYEMVMPYHLHMPSYFLETFTEYPFRGEVYKSLSHILTDFKKRLAIPYGKGKQNECQYPFPDKMS